MIETKMKKFVFAVILSSIISCCKGNIEIECGKEITIKIEKNTIEGFPDNDTTLMLGESRKCNETAPFPGTECIPTTDGNFLVWTLEDFTWCGGQKIINSEGNEVLSYKISRDPNEDSSVIRYTPCGYIEVTCSYSSINGTSNSTLDVVLNPYEGTNTSLSGDLVAELVLTTDASFSMETSTASFSLNEDVYVKAKLSNVDHANYALGLLGCRAAKTNDPGDTDYYELIDENGCKEQTVVVHNNGEAEVNFSFKAFVWADMTEDLFIFCDLGVCPIGDTSCISSTVLTCPSLRRRRRSLDSNLFRRQTTNKRKIFVNKQVKINN